HSKIMDIHRKRKFQQRVNGWLGRNNGDDEEPEDPLLNVPGPGHLRPDVRHQNAEDIALLDQTIRSLPLRQRQAFMLRCWEGLSTAETDTAMKCSEGSVKTHYSRAMHSLRSVVGGQYE